MFSILLQAPAGGGMYQLLFFGLIFVIFYFFMIRPQQKKQKEAKKFIDNLQKGDQVVTIGGLHGEVAELTDTYVVLQVDKSTRLKFEKSSISQENSARLNAKKEPAKA